MAISQGSNLINVVVHNSADSCGASPGTIILSHVLIEEENCGSFLQEEPPPPAPAIHLIHFISKEASSAISSNLAAGLNSGDPRSCRRRPRGRRQIWVDDERGGGRVGAAMSERSGRLASHSINLRGDEARGRARIRQ